MKRLTASLLLVLCFSAHALGGVMYPGFTCDPNVQQCCDPTLAPCGQLPLTSNVIATIIEESIINAPR